MIEPVGVDDGYRILRSGGPALITLRRDAVVVRGDDAASYLQGQLSQDLSGLTEGDSTWSLLLQPDGKLGWWLRVTALPAGAFLLDVDGGSLEAVVARLNRFKLRTAFELTELPAEDPLVALRLAGPAPGDLLKEIEDDIEGEVARMGGTLPLHGGIDLLAVKFGLPEVPVVPPAALEIVRIEAGMPMHGAEIVDGVIPAELGQWLIDASVSFTKGCYTGQELVARVDSRGGNVPRHLRGLIVEGDVVPPVGAEIVTDPTGTAKVVGTVTSSVRSPGLGPIALAFVHRTVEPPADVELRWDGGGASAEVRDLPLR